MKINDDKLREMFRELHRVPKRVNRLDEIETDELIYFGLQNKLPFKAYPIISAYDDISVLTNLLIHQNRKFSPKKLPETVIDNHLFHTAMFHSIVGKESNEQVATTFEDMLATWDLNKLDYQDERKIVNAIIEYLTGQSVNSRIFIKEKAIRDQVVSDLSNYVDPFDRDKLADLLAGKHLKPGQTIHFTGQVNALVYLFRQMYEIGCINNQLDKTVVKVWLRDNFQTDKGKLNEHTVWTHLTEKVRGEGKTIYEKLLDQNNSKLIISRSLIN